MNKKNVTDVHANKNRDNVEANHHSRLRGPSKTVGLTVRGVKIVISKCIGQNTPIYDVWQRNQ